VLTLTPQGPTPWMKDTVAGRWLDSSVYPREAANAHALLTTGPVNPIFVGHPDGIRSQNREVLPRRPMPRM